jgi:hypothetical protein
MTLASHGGPVYAAVFSPDGERLATTSGDGTARIWPVDPLPLARARRPRERAPAERQRFEVGAPTEPAANRPALPTKREAGVWNQDLADYFARDMQDKEADLPAWSRAALVSLAAGDHAGYRRICGAILETFLRSGDPNAVNSTAWICAVGPEAVADLQPLPEALEKAIGPTPDANQLNRLDAVLYRAGRFGDAVQRLDQAMARRDGLVTLLGSP